MAKKIGEEPEVPDSITGAASRNDARISSAVQSLTITISSLFGSPDSPHECPVRQSETDEQHPGQISSEHGLSETAAVSRGCSDGRGPGCLVSDPSRSRPGLTSAGNAANSPPKQALFPSALRGPPLATRRPLSNPLRATQAPASEAGFERVAVDAKQARRLAHIPAHTLEHPQHDLALELLGGLHQGEAVHPRTRVVVRNEQVERQVTEADQRALGQSHEALDDVLQLSYVARPPILLQNRERFGREALDAPAELLAVLADEV